MALEARSWEWCTARTPPMGTMPEALVLDVPEYSGPCFYPGQPTWVPILPSVSINHNAGSRTQFPVVAGFALTINKAQGLTIREGVVIHLANSERDGGGSVVTTVRRIVGVLFLFQRL